MLKSTTYVLIKVRPLWPYQLPVDDDPMPPNGRLAVHFRGFPSLGPMVAF